MNLVDFNSIVDDTLAFFDEADWSKVKLTLCRYNTEQELDRIVIQVRGEKKVTIHTADVGQR
jgi:hypothetical protein